MITNDEQEKGTLVATEDIRLRTRFDRRNKHLPVWRLLPEQTQVHFEDGLEETHIRALVQTDLVLPEVDYQNFR